MSGAREKRKKKGYAPFKNVKEELPMQVQGELMVMLCAVP